MLLTPAAISLASYRSLVLFAIKIIYNLHNIRVIYTLKLKHIIMWIIFFYLDNTWVVTMPLNDRWKSFSGIVIRRYGVIKADIFCHGCKESIKYLTNFLCVRDDLVTLLNNYFVIMKCIFVGNKWFDCLPESLLFGSLKYAAFDCLLIAVIRFRCFL